MNFFSSKRTATDAQLSPPTSTSKNSKQMPTSDSLLSQLAEFDTDSIVKDPSVPDYAKTIILQLSLVIQSLQFKQPINESPSIAEEQRLRSVVITNLPESQETSPTARAKADFEQVERILDICNVEAKPLAVYRMGKILDKGKAPSGRPRLLKVELHGKTITRQFLRGKSALKSSNNPVFNKLMVRESQTPEQREQRKVLQDECTKKRNETNEDYIIYRDKVFLRSDIKKQ
jgi:hypothetical protein